MRRIHPSILQLLRVHAIAMCSTPCDEIPNLMPRDTPRFSERHEFEKPNDAQALNLMDLSAKVGQRVFAEFMHAQ